ncbi:MAG: hypothetical protein GXY76_21925 [Chloroflexi bacterium]|nr:hypothetical protein [Chloroflexota bacterium]
MNSRERLLTAIDRGTPDHVPLLCWCFGFAAPPHLRWQRDGRDRRYWYTLRLEHIHTLPQPWDLEDDFRRVERWLALGLDDVLEVSPPWGLHAEVRFRDWREPPTAQEPCAFLGRAYATPAGELRHVVRQTQEETPPGWVIQPDQVPLIEDFNIPRGVKHAVAGPEDLPKLRYLLGEPDADQRAAYRQRMAAVRRFAGERGVLVQGWSAFGMDLAVWLCGVEGAVLMAMTQPAAFEELMSLIAAFDRRRTEFMLEVGGVDLVVQRGWYSSTEFWSPRLFRQHTLPHLRLMSALAHQAGARYAYAMTTGVMALAEPLLEAGIDLLYYADPVQDRLDLGAAKAVFGGKIALAGGVNSGVTLAGGSREEVRRAVAEAVGALGPDGFILAPVDALFPDTPWESVQAMIEAWREVRG